MELSNDQDQLSNRIERLIDTDDYTNDQKRRAVYTFAKISEYTDAEFKTYIQTNDNLASSLAKNVLVARDLRTKSIASYPSRSKTGPFTSIPATPTYRQAFRDKMRKGKR